MENQLAGLQREFYDSKGPQVTVFMILDVHQGRLERWRISWLGSKEDFKPLRGIFENFERPGLI